jgi:hypothetical protein
VRDFTTIFNSSGDHIATIGLNDAHKLWQLVVVRCPEMEFFCPDRDTAFAAWHDEFDSETGLPARTGPNV